MRRIFAATPLNFPSVVAKTTRQMRYDVLCSCIVFPKTENISGDKPIATVHLDNGRLEWDVIKTEVDKHSELIALGARNDLTHICNVLQEVEEVMHLDQFDNIQIYRSGLDLLRIANTKRAVGRSAYLDINEVRRRLTQAMQPPDANYVYLYVAIGVAIGVVLAQIIGKDEMTKIVKTRLDNATGPALPH